MPEELKAACELALDYLRTEALLSPSRCNSPLRTQQEDREYVISELLAALKNYREGQETCK